MWASVNVLTNDVSWRERHTRVANKGKIILEKRLEAVKLLLFREKLIL